MSATFMEDAKNTSDYQSKFVIPLYGNTSDVAYYYTYLHVGTPGQAQSVIVDTGSPVLAMACKTCSNCSFKHINANYDVTASSSAHWLACRNPECYTDTCVALTNDLFSEPICSYYQAYMEGSVIAGEFFSDILKFPTLSQEASAPQFRYNLIGCHKQETSHFLTQKANGIMGLAIGDKGIPHFLGALQSSNVIDKAAFALCISENGGIFTLGPQISPILAHGFMSAYKTSTTNSTNVTSASVERSLVDTLFAHSMSPLNEVAGQTSSSGEHSFGGKSIRDHFRWIPLTSASKYEIALKQLSAEGDQFTQSHILGDAPDFGPCILDSGSTYSYFPKRVFENIKIAVLSACHKIGSCRRVDDLKDESLCLKFGAKAFSMNAFPNLIITTSNDNKIFWYPISYLQPQGKFMTNIWCLALDMSLKHQTVLGMTFMKYNYIIFDRLEGKIGIVESDCPSMIDDGSHMLSFMSKSVPFNEFLHESETSKPIRKPRSTSSPEPTINSRTVERFNSNSSQVLDSGQTNFDYILDKSNLRITGAALLVLILFIFGICRFTWRLNLNRLLQLRPTRQYTRLDSGDASANGDADLEDART